MERGVGNAQTEISNSAHAVLSLDLFDDCNKLELRSDRDRDTTPIMQAFVLLQVIMQHQSNPPKFSRDVVGSSTV